MFLLNVCFKVFTKVHSIRFDQAFGKVVFHCENAFIHGRNITDGVMSLHEILHEANIKNQQEVAFFNSFRKILW
jgi:Leu/Phe-tRNA-protein transferase